MKYDLVFEGGGAKGIAFAGACDEFLRRGHSFDRLLGTSAGAITAVLLAAGYTSAGMLAALAEKEGGHSVFAGFMGVPPPFSDEEISKGAIRRLLEGVDFTFLWDSWERKLDEKLARALAANERFRHVLALIERGGWFAADPFMKWLRVKLDSSPRNDGRRISDMSLEKFFNYSGVPLSVVASDTTAGTILVLNHRTAPDCPVVWAVRMSMNIPLIWDEVVWQPAWGKYLGGDATGHIVVDGGLLSNFPIELFVSDAPQITRLMGPKTNNQVLGLLIDETLPVSRDKGLLFKINIKPGELSTVQRLARLVDTATGAHDKMVIQEHKHLVARLPAQGYGTTEFDMTDERRTALVNAGRTAMALFLDTPPGLVLPTKGGYPAARILTEADRIAARLLGQNDLLEEESIP